MKTQKHSKEIDDFSGLPSWAETFNFYHHSPSGCQRPDGMEFLEKVEARPRKIFSPPNAPMISGRQSTAFRHGATCKAQFWDDRPLHHFLNVW